jgi:hypothetical protein
MFVSVSILFVIHSQDETLTNNSKWKILLNTQK